MINAYANFAQNRTAIAAPNVWVQLTIPAGAKNVVIGLEGTTFNFRISSVDTLNPATEGLFLTAGSMYELEGQAAADVVLFISATGATVAIMQWTN